MSPTRSMVGDDRWWTEHWESAPSEIIAFLGQDQIPVEGSVADFGCGDGIMAAGLATLSGASVVGFDIDPTDQAVLDREMQRRGIDLGGIDVTFRRAGLGSIEADDAEFDLGVSWSVLEHVFDREGYMREASRVIKPYGRLFVQVWPLWFSEHGHHNWQWLHPFDHLRLSRDGLIEKLRRMDRLPPGSGTDTESVEAFLADAGLSRDEWIAEVMASFDSCNRITLDQIQALLLEHGFGISRVELLTSPYYVPMDCLSVPLSDLSIAGVKLTAWRKP